MGENERVRGGGPRLLLVEDEAELATMLRGLFVDEGYCVDAATNGQTGLHYGLGLALVADISTAHHGSVAVSPSPAMTLRISLPSAPRKR
jgi:signal transduction histidine kinase